MALIKISQLPSAPSIDGSELSEIVQGGVNKKVLKSVERTYYQSNLGSAAFAATTDFFAATSTTTDLPEGTSLYFTEARVRSTTLTGLSVSGSTIASTDTVLQAFGKLQNQINAVAGGVTYQGTWNANTNSPALVSSVGTKGYYYVVNTPGATNLNGVTDWKLGDWAIFNGTAWEKVDNTDAVISVNGYTGAVTLVKGDIGLGNVENTALSTWAGSSNITTVGTLTAGATGSGFTINFGTSTLSGRVPYANIAQGSALSVLGVTGNATADVASIAAGTDGFVLRRSGTTLAFGTVATAGITNSAVTFAKIQNSAAAGLSVIGRSAQSAGVFAEITAGTDGNILRRSGTTLGFGSIDLAAAGAVGSTILPRANGGLGVNLSAPGSDAILFYDVSATNYAYLSPNATLNITGTTLSIPLASYTTGSWLYTGTDNLDGTYLMTWNNLAGDLILGISNGQFIVVGGDSFLIEVGATVPDGAALFSFNNTQDEALSFQDKTGNVFMSFDSARMYTVFRRPTVSNYGAGFEVIEGQGSAMSTNTAAANSIIASIPVPSGYTITVTLLVSEACVAGGTRKISSFPFSMTASNVAGTMDSNTSSAANSNRITATTGAFNMSANNSTKAIDIRLMNETGTGYVYDCIVHYSYVLRPLPV